MPSQPDLVSPDPTAQRGKSELALRVASALVLAPLAVGGAVMGGSLFALFWTAAALLAMREWLCLVGFSGKRLMVMWGVAGLGIAVGAWLAESGIHGSVIVPPLLGGLVLAAFRPAGSSRLWSFLGVLYTSVIALGPIALLHEPGQGLVPVLWVFAVVWLTDICAYFVGRAVGGPKLWPKVSPKKTWSGFVGGTVGGVATALGVVAIARHGFDLEWAWGPRLFGLTVLASIVGQGGDLFESFLKRRFGVKDTGHLIPGHGGVLDRLDSFIVVCLLLVAAVQSGALGAAP
jgi:phosphatidate cytidylyltransferase